MENCYLCHRPVAQESNIHIWWFEPRSGEPSVQHREFVHHHCMSLAEQLITERVSLPAIPQKSPETVQTAKN
jgi:hypothetical protein